MSEEKRAQRALAESEARFRIVSTTAGEIVGEGDIETGSLVWFGDVDAVLGYDPGEFPRTIQGWKAHLHPDDRARVMEVLEREVCGNQRGVTLQYRIRTKDGGYRHRALRAAPRPGDAGCRKFVGACVDDTDRVRLEADVARHRDALAHATRVAALGELQASMAHELNQPLTAILSNAQAATRFLDQDPLDVDELRAILTDIIADDRRAREVIRRLRALLMKSESRRELVDINALIRQALDLVRSELLIQGVSSRLELGPTARRITLDPIQIEQVVLNLVMNGVDAAAAQASEARSVTISSHCNQSNVAVSVRDTGHGIAEADLPRLFESFYTTKPRGLGMGLAICRSLVEAHGGRIWVADSSGAGTTVTFTLPIEEGGQP